MLFGVPIPGPPVA